MEGAQDHDGQSYSSEDQLQQRQQWRTWDGLRDVVLWRRNKAMMSATILVVSTAAWVLLEVYQFTALTLLCWLAISCLSLLFLWGTFLRLMGKPPPDLRVMEMSDQRVLEAALNLKALSEAGLRWMFHLTVEGDWLELTATIAGLLLLSYVATFCDLPTLVYIGVITGMTVPVIYENFGDKIRRCGQMVKEQGRRCYEKADEKVITKIKEKVSKSKNYHQVNDKKIE